MILVDTSAWIDFIRGTDTPVRRRLADLIPSDSVIASTDPVRMEILAGARNNAHRERLRRMLSVSVSLLFEPIVDFETAARIYQRCRAAGVTPRSMIDCMIASVAIRHRAAVLANDTDFARIASVVALELDPATPSE